MNQEKTAKAGLTGLMILQTVMLLSLYSKTAPHPPKIIPFAGMAPFVAACLAAAGAAWAVGPTIGWTGRILSASAVLGAMVSYGPQKYLDPQFALVWPSVIAGQIAAIAVVSALMRQRDASAASA